MALRTILHYPDPRLHRKALPVERVDDAVRRLVDDMAETMYAAPGIGLAAIQIDVPLRVIVIDISDAQERTSAAGDTTPGTEEAEPRRERRPRMPGAAENHDRFQVFINPQIVDRDGTQTFEEGCLSVPGVYEEVTRAGRVRVRALDRDGNPFELEAEGLLATCLQHEIDHLDGKVFVDYLSRLKQSRIRKKLEKQQKLAM